MANVSTRRYELLQGKYKSLQAGKTKTVRFFKEAASPGLAVLGAASTGAASGMGLDIEIMYDEDAEVGLDLPIGQIVAGVGMLYAGYKRKNASLVAFGSGVLYGAVAIGTRDAADYWNVTQMAADSDTGDNGEGSGDNGGN
ncbi:MAG: hypothetical protein RI826_10010 [Chlorobium phaeovibrioides]|nr:hypothetical protein [Chlorobium phaeovibrioides]